jgi:hypothetical protein
VQPLAPGTDQALAFCGGARNYSLSLGDRCSKVFATIALKYSSDSIPAVCAGLFSSLDPLDHFTISLARKRTCPLTRKHGNAPRFAIR